MNLADEYSMTCQLCYPLGVNIKCYWSISMPMFVSVRSDMHVHKDCMYVGGNIL
jgi:hypothetical protein